MKIKLTIEGDVPDYFDPENVITTGDCGSLSVVNDEGTKVKLSSHRTLSAEVIVQPEPEYKAGQVWSSPSGHLYRRTGAGNWQAFGVAGTLVHTFPARPMKLEIGVDD